MTSLSSEETPAVPPWKAHIGSILRRVPIVARSGVGPAYLRWQRRRQRAARRAAEARGDRSLSRPALYDIDRKLERYVGELEGGYFVEAGANDGFEQSNTYHLERFHKWTGLLVEPVPHLYREACLERPGAHVVHAALTGPEQEGTELALEYGGLMTVVAGSRGSGGDDAAYVSDAFALGLEAPMTVSAPGRTLSSLLDEVGAPEVDLMSLDLEGFEAQALTGLDLDRHAPRFLLIEARDAESRLAIEDVLGSHFACCEQLSIHDFLYRRVAHASSSSSGTALSSHAAPA